MRHYLAYRYAKKLTVHHYSTGRSQVVSRVRLVSPELLCGLDERLLRLAELNHTRL